MELSTSKEVIKQENSYSKFSDKNDSLIYLFKIFKFNQWNLSIISRRYY